MVCQAGNSMKPVILASFFCTAFGDTLDPNKKTSNTPLPLAKSTNLSLPSLSTYQISTKVSAAFLHKTLASAFAECAVI